ncbi:MAG: hypothetical protein PUF72_01140 [Clostridiales bacterium]|nr:hypothetical protein [Clostridiales bacterium]
MKNVMKKMLSAALSGCMALSAIGSISAGAATAESDLVVFENNFEDSSNISLKKPGGIPAEWKTEESTQNHYVYHGDTWDPYAIDFDRPISTANFTVNYDFYYDGKADAVIVGDINGMGNTNAATSTTMTIMYTNTSGEIRAFCHDSLGIEYKTADGTSNATLESGKWYSYSATLYTGTRRMTATITERGKSDTVASFDSDVNYKDGGQTGNAWWGYAVKGTSFENLITLRNCNLDNVKVAEIANSQTVFEENFDGETIKPLRKAKTTDTISSVTTDPTDANNKCISYAVSWESHGFDFDRPIDTTKFTVDYDFYYEGKTGGVFVGDFDGKGFDNVTSSTVMTIMWYDGSTGKIAAFANETGPKYKDASGNDATLTSGKWYSYSAILDTENRRLTAAITEKGTNTAVASFDQTAIYKEDKDNDVWWNYAIADTSYENLMVLLNGTLDNINVSEVYEAPVVTSVTYKNGKGEVLNNFSERVKSVDIAFSDKMARSTMTSDNISFTNNDANVPYTGKLSGDLKTYTMTFNQDIVSGNAVLNMSNLKSYHGYDMAQAYTKNIKVIGKNSLFEENFEDYTAQSEYAGVRITSGSTQPIIGGTPNNKYMQVTSSLWTDVWALDFTNAVATQNFNVQYDFYYGGKDVAVFTGEIDQYAARRKVMTLMYVDDADSHVRAFGVDGTGVEYKDANGNPAVLESNWYTYSASLDIANRRLVARISPRNSTTVVASIDANCIYKDAADDTKEVWYGWAIDTTQYKSLACMFDVKLDNIKVEYNPNAIGNFTIDDTTTVGTFADVTSGSWKVSIDTENDTGEARANVAIAAIYNEKGQLLDVMTSPIELSAYELGTKTADFGSVTLPEGAASLKIMYWNGLDKCNPLVPGIKF